MNNYTKLSIVVPAYNEEDRIYSTLLSLHDYFANVDYTYEILIINDGSTDKTKEVVTDFINEHPNCNFFLNGYKDNRGKGSAVQFGMLAATGEYTLFIDADGAIDINHIEDFWKQIKKGYDVVIGSIELKGHTAIDNNQWYRKYLGRMSKLLIRLTATPGIYDTQRAFKMFKSQVSSDIFKRQTIMRWGFDIEVLVIARTLGYNIKEIPVTWINPDGSHIGGVREYFQTLFELASILSKKFTHRYNRGSAAVLSVLREIQMNR